MRLSLIFLCSMFTLAARSASRKDFEETCLNEKSCVLSCHNQDGLSEVVWSKDMLAVQCFPDCDRYHQHKNFRNRTSLFVHEIPNGNCSLMISNVRPQDKGIYKCVTTSQRRNEEWLFYKLGVNAPVEEVVIEQSGDFLICRSDRVHPKPECQWSGAFSNSSVQQDGQSLYSTNCSTPLLHDVSNYTCTVSTPFSSKRATYIQLPPVTISGFEASLSCAPSTGPVKAVSWKFNHSDTIANLSGQLSVSERWRPFVKNISKSGNLILNNLISDHLGFFTCVTSTDTETSTANMRLEMKESLNRPVFIVAVLITVSLTVLVFVANRCGQTTPAGAAPDSQPNGHQSSSAAVPEDRFHAVWFICGLLGLESVLPWHFFVTASLYFEQRMDKIGVLSCIVLVSLLPRLISELFVFRFPQRKHTTLFLFTITIILIAMVIFIKVPMAGETFFGISMCMLWFASVLSYMVQCNLNVEVNLLPRKHRDMFVHGQTWAGILAAIVMIVCVTVTEDAELQVICHFCFAFFVSMAALVAYGVLQRVEFATYHFNKERQIKNEIAVELLPLNNNNDQEHPESPDRRVVLNLCARFCVVLVPILTFSVYPAITLDVHTVHSGIWSRYFILVGCFLNCNVVKLIYHSISHWKTDIISGAQKHFLIVFPILVVIHTAFIPFFMFCNVQPRAFLPVSAHLSKDVFFIMGMALFTLSDGFLTHLSLLYAESGADTGISKLLWQALGGTIGACLSFAFRFQI